ncbi:MAG: sigma-70 family RNA polymerase sigma factor [Phycisphaerales bacterium]|nr:sigma-70 family RNA polymerase sigma factor [Phycisphaerales bacterium]
MVTDPCHETTLLLERLRQGDTSAAQQLLPLVYDELRSLAGRYFRRQRSDHTLQPTALVHEAFLKLVDQTDPQWNGRQHFFAVAAMAMRQILVNHALARKALKRGGGQRRVLLDDAIGSGARSDGLDVLALHDALERLKQVDERKHRLVELRFFAGLAVDEAAEVLGVSKTTAESDWRAARAWLNLELTRNA